MINNKDDRPLQYYTEKFRELDAADIAERCGIELEGNVLRFRFLNADYEISHPDCVFTSGEKGKYLPLVEDVHAQILMLRFLTEGSSASSSGRFLTYRDMPWGNVYFEQFKGRCILRLAYSFGRDIASFAKAAEAIGGVRLSDGDISYEIRLINGLLLRLILWEADDEFPPSSQILFSDNFPVAFTAEDMAAVGDVVIGTLKKQL